MDLKQFAAGAVLACVALPTQAWDFRDHERHQPHTFLYMRIPLDGRTPKEQVPVWGLAVRGKKEYQVMDLNSQNLTRFTQMGMIESPVLIVGAVVAAGAVVVAGAGSKSASGQQQQQQQVAQQQAAQQQAAQQQAAQQQQQQAQPPAAPCPVRPSC